MSRVTITEHLAVPASRHDCDHVTQYVTDHPRKRSASPACSNACSNLERRLRTISDGMADQPKLTYC